jgi:serine/threonine-protein kinase
MHNPERFSNLDGSATKLGRYEIVCKLGVGGMADVYLAHQPGPFHAGKLVVLKHLRTGVVEDTQFLQMFADESRIAVRLNHPNVVHTYEVVAEGNDYYLILEFLDGKSLHQVLQLVSREKVPLALHVWMLTQVLAGLHYAHEIKDFNGFSMCVVHRDVSPANVFVTYEGEVKILDFGIAKSTAATSATREGIIKGKLGYASPEQCLCKETDRRTDVYAVGVMLWEALAERKRSLGETSAATYQARIQGAEPPIEQVAPNAPPELVAICNRALEQQPEQRYQTALEFRQALDHYLQSVGWADGAGQLRKFMHRHFAIDMAEMRQRIDEHIGRSQSSIEGQNVLQKRPNSVPPQLSGTIDTRELYNPLLKREALPPSTNHRRSKYQIAVGAILGSAITVAGAAWFLGSNGKSDVRADSNATNVSRLNLPTVGRNVDGSASPPAKEISIALSANPSTAVLLLDGRRISNPYRAVHGIDNSLHHLTVTLDGYQPIEKELSFEGSIEANFALSPLRTIAPPKKSVAMTKAAPIPVKLRSGNEPLSTERSTPSVVPQPGEDLRGTISSSKARDIEETDPYKR